MARRPSKDGILSGGLDNGMRFSVPTTRPLKRTTFTDEQILAMVKEGEVEAEGVRPQPDARDHRANLLPLDGEVRRDGAQCDAAAEAARGRLKRRYQRWANAINTAVRARSER